jgi:hypothetical protein
LVAFDEIGGFAVLCRLHDRAPTPNEVRLMCLIQARTANRIAHPHEADEVVTFGDGLTGSRAPDRPAESPAKAGGLS